MTMRQRLRHIGDKYWPLAVWALAITIVRQLLNHRDFAAGGDPFDSYLLFGVGVIVSVSVVIMLVQTEEWTIRALGVLGLITFDAGLYGLSGGGRLFGYTVSNDDVNWLRACIIVSAPLLLISQVMFLSAGIRHRRRPER